MNKLAIPAILTATIMVAGMFAFMPVEQASTVHLSGTTVINAAGIAADSIGASEIAAGAVTEIQTQQVVVTSDADIATTLVCTGGDAPFLVYYTITAIADTEVITIGGTATGTDLVYTADLTAANSAGSVLSGVEGGTAGQTVTFDSSAAGADIHITIVSPFGSTAPACV